MLFSWVQYSDNVKNRTKIGLYTYSTNTIDVLFTFDKELTIIQASVNYNRTILGYIVKNSNSNDEANKSIYNAYMVNLKNNNLYDFKNNTSKQVMIQFLYHKHSVFDDKNQNEKFLLFVHRESIVLYTISVKRQEMTDFPNNDSLTHEYIVHAFNWAQWDCVHQILYYIHYRKPKKCLVEGEDSENGDNVVLTPVLSGLQFHDDLPHETVVNI